MYNNFKALKYHLKALFELKLSNYNNALKYFTKEISADLSPDKERKVNYDYLMLEIAEKIFAKNKRKLTRINVNFDETHVLILNSEIYDFGGHTELALRFAKQFKNDYKITFLLTGLNKYSAKSTPNKAEIIKSNVSNFVEFSTNQNYEHKVLEIYDFIIRENITTIISNIHMQDCVSVAVIGLIKKYTNINVIFWNHADHYFTLGTEFADTILTRCKNGKALSENIKYKTNVLSFPIIEKVNEIIEYPSERFKQKRTELKIPDNAFITITGTPYYKIKSKNNEYLKLIKEVLNQNSNVYHLLISNLTQKEKNKAQKVIGANHNRLIILPFQSDFDFYVQLSDLYIDSFPQGSALTLIDFIRHGKPPVIKINEKNPIQSFEMYLYEGYEYACKSTQEMFDKISKLISDKNEYSKISQKVRDFYIDRYNIDYVKKKYAKLIK